MSTNFFESGEADPRSSTGKPTARALRDHKKSTAQGDAGSSESESDDSGVDQFIQDLHLSDDDDESVDKIEFSDDEFDDEYDDDEYDEDVSQKRRKTDAPTTNFGSPEPILFSDDDENEFDDDDEDEIPIEDDYQEGYDLRDELRAAHNFRTKNKAKISAKQNYWKRKMMRSSARELQPEVRQNLSDANEAFVRKDFNVAHDLYLEVIKRDPKNHNAYKTLGEICKQQGKLNECCNYWFIAASLHPWDSRFWGSVAELSAELGHIDQAIQCYTRAISLTNKKRVGLRFTLNRAVLYRDKKQFGRALEGFQKVREAYPMDSAIIKQIVSVYVQQKRINDAINLYMKILDYNIKLFPHFYPSNADTAERSYPMFSWAELNILLELYILQKSYRVGIKVIKLVSRWIQGRQDETWWDDIDDDAEFDAERRLKVIEGLKRPFLEARDRKHFQLPIDIRYKIGHLRLGLGQKDEALHHFGYLLNEGEEDIADLYFEAGKILEESGNHDDALQFLTLALTESDELSEDPELINLLAKCFLEVGDYQQAKNAYEALLAYEPENLEHKIALAETLHHIGDAKGAHKYLLEVSAEAKKRKGSSTTPIEESEDDEVRSESTALIKNSERSLKSSKSNKLSSDEKLQREEKGKRKALDIWRRMCRLEEAIQKEDRNAIKAWMQLAMQLIEMFESVRSFFPRDKNRAFKGIVLYRRKKKMDIDEKLARVYNLYEGVVSDDNLSRHLLTSKTDYRGLGYDIWFKIFVQYSMLLANYEDNIEDAIEIIDVAMTVSIFVQDKHKESMLKLVKLLFSVKKEDHAAITVLIRSFLISNQMSPFIYKFFMCCFSQGIKSWEYFTNYNHQKFFLRQLKAYDSVFLNKKITGMATITASFEGFQKLSREHPDLIYIYSNLLGGSRSYVSSVVYLNRAYKEYNQDPMICLVLGLAHIHRAMQRLSNNRHMQLLQGLSYILEYRDLRIAKASASARQEIEYNFGRLFHMLGLTSLAVTHYNRVLEIKIDNPDYDMLCEAAYNLALIYNINSNSHLAREITAKYLTI